MSKQARLNAVDTGTLPAIQTFIPNSQPLSDGRTPQFACLYIPTDKSKTNSQILEEILAEGAVFIHSDKEKQKSPEYIISYYICALEKKSEKSELNKNIDKEFAESVSKVTAAIFELKLPEKDKYDILRQLVQKISQVGDARSYVILDARVLIQNSPISEETLRKLMTGPSVFGIGTFTGLTSLTADDPIMVFLAVGGGIVVVGTALGIGRALNEGLYQRVLSIVAPKQVGRDDENTER